MNEANSTNTTTSKRLKAQAALLGTFSLDASRRVMACKSYMKLLEIHPPGGGTTFSQKWEASYIFYLAMHTAALEFQIIIIDLSWL